MSLEVRCGRNKRISKRKDKIRDLYPIDIKFRENFVLRNITFTYFNRFNLRSEHERFMFPNIDYDKTTAEMRGDVVDIGSKREVLLESKVLLANQFIHAKPKEFYWFFSESPYYPSRIEKAHLSNLGTSLGRYVFWELVDNRDFGQIDKELIVEQERNIRALRRAFPNMAKFDPDFSRKIRKRNITRYSAQWLTDLTKLESNLCSLLKNYCEQRISEYGDGYRQNGRTEQVEKIILPIGNGKIKEVCLLEPRSIGDLTVTTPIIIYDELSRGIGNIARLISKTHPNHRQKMFDETYLLHGDRFGDENVKRLFHMFGGEIEENHLKKLVKGHETYLYNEYMKYQW